MIIRHVIRNKRTRHVSTWGNIQEIKIFENMLNNVIEKKGKVYCIGGEFHHNFWESEFIVKKLEECIEKGVTFLLAGGPTIDLESRHLLKLIDENKITFYSLPRRDNSHHFRVTYPNCDISYHSGLEQMSKKPKVFIWENNCFLAKKLIRRFEKLTKNLKPVDKGKSIKSLDFLVFSGKNESKYADKDEINALKNFLGQNC